MDVVFNYRGLILGWPWLSDCTEYLLRPPSVNYSLIGGILYDPVSAVACVDLQDHAKT